MLDSLLRSALLDESDSDTTCSAAQQLVLEAERRDAPEYQLAGLGLMRIRCTTSRFVNRVEPLLARVEAFDEARARALVEHELLLSAMRRKSPIQVRLSGVAFRRSVLHGSVAWRSAIDTVCLANVDRRTPGHWWWCIHDKSFLNHYSRGKVPVDGALRVLAGSLPQLSYLQLRVDVTPELAELVLGAPWFPCLSRLQLEDVRSISPEQWDRLVETPFERLRELKLTDSFVDDARLQQLLAAPWARGCEISLSRHHNITEQGLEAALTSPHLASLGRLHIGGSWSAAPHREALKRWRDEPERCPVSHLMMQRSIDDDAVPHDDWCDLVLRFGRPSQWGPEVELNAVIQRRISAVLRDRIDPHKADVARGVLQSLIPFDEWTSGCPWNASEEDYRDFCEAVGAMFEQIPGDPKLKSDLTRVIRGMHWPMEERLAALLGHIAHHADALEARQYALELMLIFYYRSRSSECMAQIHEVLRRGDVAVLGLLQLHHGDVYVPLFTRGAESPVTRLLDGAVERDMGEAALTALRTARGQGADVYASHLVGLLGSEHDAVLILALREAGAHLEEHPHPELERHLMCILRQHVNPSASVDTITVSDLLRAAAWGYGTLTDLHRTARSTVCNDLSWIPLRLIQGTAVETMEAALQPGRSWLDRSTSSKALRIWLRWLPTPDTWAERVARRCLQDTRPERFLHRFESVLLPHLDAETVVEATATFVRRRVPISELLGVLRPENVVREPKLLEALFDMYRRGAPRRELDETMRRVLAGAPSIRAVLPPIASPIGPLQIGVRLRRRMVRLNIGAMHAVSDHEQLAHARECAQLGPDAPFASHLIEHPAACRT